CSVCVDGRPIIKRTKRSLDCVPCTYLQPTESINNPFAVQAPVSPVGIPPPHLRGKRAGCLPHPQCMLAPRRAEETSNLSTVNHAMAGITVGRSVKPRENAHRLAVSGEPRVFPGILPFSNPRTYRKIFLEEFSSNPEKCLRREKRATGPECEVDEFLVTRMKRQAYNPSGILDIVKLLSKTMGEGGGFSCMLGGIICQGNCVLAQKEATKATWMRIDKEVAAHKQALKEHEEQHIRQKRQFFSPDAGAACVPCPAWVTLALASRKKRSTNSSEESEEEQSPRMTLSEAIADIRRKAGYKLGFEAWKTQNARFCTGGGSVEASEKKFGSPY
ncbi:hypothetical protein OSTOST_08693, partial [Ostertagia ostertagi]